MVTAYEKTIRNHDYVDVIFQEDKLVNLQIESFSLDSERIKMNIKAIEIDMMLD